MKILPTSLDALEEIKKENEFILRMLPIGSEIFSKSKPEARYIKLKDHQHYLLVRAKGEYNSKHLRISYEYISCDAIKIKDKLML